LLFALLLYPIEGSGQNQPQKGGVYQVQHKYKMRHSSCSKEISVEKKEDK